MSKQSKAHCFPTNLPLKICLRFSGMVKTILFQHNILKYLYAQYEHVINKSGLAVAFKTS